LVQDDASHASEVHVISWNIYHGRDAPPDRRLNTLRSLLLRREEDDGVFVQINRSLEQEFGALIAQAGWSVCLLQESPPRWARSLAQCSGAQAFRVLTSRNQLDGISRALARWNPDLIGAWEGGSNLTLVRAPWRLVTGSERSLLLNPLRKRGLRERRRMGFVRLRSGDAHGSDRELCVANVHASHYSRLRAEEDVRTAANAAAAWAGATPLVFAGDFNLRLAGSTLFEELERDLGLAGPTSGDAIDHLLTRGLEPIQPPVRWATERRDALVRRGAETRRVRLSDHAPVEAVLRLPGRMRY
jgi:endonuclease/exonuclease/phosphatase family metal-dependent hydrolase